MHSQRREPNDGRRHRIVTTREDHKPRGRDAARHQDAEMVVAARAAGDVITEHAAKQRGPIEATRQAHDRRRWCGLILGVSGQGGDMVVLADASDATHRVDAWMKTGAAQPALSKPATLTCTMKIARTVNGAGEPGLDASLTDCAP